MSDHVLVVDGDEFVRQIHEEALTGAGFRVSLCGDGFSAWESLDRDPGRFDLILMDREIPGLDGVAFLRRMKADPRFRDLPVILLAGDSDQGSVHDGLQAGAYYYLTRPSPHSVLVQVVHNALDELRHKRDLKAQIGTRTLGLLHLNRAEFRVRTLVDAKNLAIVLADASGQPERTVNGYAELLINAVEHGNLGITYDEKSRLVEQGVWAEEVEERLGRAPYSEREVTVQVSRVNDTFTVIISDEGEGFDWRGFIDFDPDRAFDLHGRGIALARQFSFEDIRYVGSGNIVVATVF
ncbi:MAG: response regulator [Gammaproteobacteria bacterium]